MSAKNIFAKYRNRFVTLCAAAFVLTAGAVTHADEVITMYKQTYCGCCEKWAEHIRRAGFEVTVVNTDDLAPFNERFGIPQNVASCHTAKLGSYYIVGHVPAADIFKLLDEKPNVRGLAVPGMLVGAPGMEVPGRAAAKYDSVLFIYTGETTVYVSH